MSIRKAFLGLDPGSEGCLAKIDGNTLQVEYAKLKFDDKELDSDFLRKQIFEYVQGYDLAFLTYERVNGDPKFGSNFRFGYTCGAIKSVCNLAVVDLKVRLITVQAQTWQKKVLVSNNQTTKERSVNFCKSFYPDVKLIPDGCRVADHNVADSIAIAHYGYLLYSK